MSKPKTEPKIDPLAAEIRDLIAKTKLEAEKATFKAHSDARKKIDSARAETEAHDLARKKVEAAIQKAHEMAGAAMDASDDAAFQKAFDSREALKVELAGLESKSPAARMKAARADAALIEADQKVRVQKALGAFVDAEIKRVEDAALRLKSDAARVLTLRKRLMGEHTAKPTPGSLEEESMTILMHGDPLGWICSRDRVTGVKLSPPVVDQMNRLARARVKVDTEP